MQGLLAYIQPGTSLEDMLAGRCSTHSATPAVTHVSSLCRLLQRASGFTDLALAIQRYNLDNRSSAHALALALRHIGRAGGGRLQRLALLPQATSRSSHSSLVHLQPGPEADATVDSWVLDPEVVQVVGAHFPRLTHLVLHAHGAPRHVGWEGSLSSLPRTLQMLDVSVKGGDADEVSRAVQAAALQLPSLHVLRLHELRKLPQAAPPARAPLRDLSLQRATYIEDITAALSTQLAAGLRSLSMPVDAWVEEGMPQLLSLLPGLRSLHLGQCAPRFNPPQPLQGLYQAVCSLQHLTSLRWGLHLMAAAYRQHPMQPPPSHLALPKSLQRLQIDWRPLDLPPELLVDLLEQRWVPPQCHVVLEASSALAQSDYAPAALQHPGGVSLRLPTMDALTGAEAAVEVRGMVQLDDLDVLGALEAVAAQQQPLCALFLDGGAWLLHKALRSSASATGNPPSQLTRSLQVLGFSVGTDGTKSLQAVGRMLREGRLSALKQLLIVFPSLTQAPGRDGPALDCFVQEGFQAKLASLVRAGLVVRLLPRSWSTEAKQLLRGLRAAMPDPDAVVLGLREESSCWGP